MTKEKLWAIYVAKNPQFDGDGNITLSAAGLRKMFEQTWECGRQNGFINGKAFMENQKEPQKNNMADLFKGMFGKQ